jgi:uncharacterized protein
MEIREKLSADVKTAMKEKDTLKLNTLRFAQAAIKNREIDLRPEAISAEEVMNVFKKLVKQRKESIEQYQAGGRQDLANQEIAELKILEAYMPAQMSKEQVAALVAEVVQALAAKSLKDMGPVIKEIQARSAGAADNKLVSELVKAKLSTT